MPTKKSASSAPSGMFIRAFLFGQSSTDFCCSRRSPLNRNTFQITQIMTRGSSGKMSQNGSITNRQSIRL